LVEREERGERKKVFSGGSKKKKKKKKKNQKFKMKQKTSKLWVFLASAYCKRDLNNWKKGLERYQDHGDNS
jgi:hypothetical protein